MGLQSDHESFLVAIVLDSIEAKTKTPRSFVAIVPDENQTLMSRAQKSFRKPPFPPTHLAFLASSTQFSHTFLPFLHHFHTTIYQQYYPLSSTLLNYSTPHHTLLHQNDHVCNHHIPLPSLRDSFGVPRPQGVRERR